MGHRGSVIRICFFVFYPLEKLCSTFLLSLVSCWWSVIFETVLAHKSPPGSTVDSNSSDLDPISRALCCQQFQLPWPYFKVRVHLERSKWKDEFSCSHATEFKLGRIINYMHFEIMHNCFSWLWFALKGNWCTSHVQLAVSKTQCRHCGNPFLQVASILIKMPHGMLFEFWLLIYICDMSNVFRVNVWG